MRSVMLIGDITLKSVSEATEQLLTLSENNTNPIHLFIYSDGGDSCAAIALFDVIKTCGAPVVGVVYGQCYSSAVLVLQACHLRVASPNATLMLHEGSLGAIKAPSFKEALAEIKAMQYDETVYWREVAARSGMQTANVRALERAVTYLTATQALEAKLIDAIVTGDVWGVAQALT